MFELIFSFLGSVLGSAWGLVASTMGFAFGLLIHLHTEMPRLEGALIATGIYWFLQNREWLEEKHPIIKKVLYPVSLLQGLAKKALLKLWELTHSLLRVPANFTLGLLGKAASVIKRGWDKLLGLVKKADNKLD
jgi:hypothetical protein